MKIPLFILIAFVLCGALAFGQSESKIRDRIVGTWKLVSTEQTMKDGTTRPYPHYMCAELVKSRPPEMG